MRLRNRYSLRESMEIKSKIEKVKGLRKYPRKHKITEIQRLLSPQIESRNFFLNSENSSKNKILHSKNNNEFKKYYLNTFNRIFNYDRVNNISVKNNYLYKPEKIRKKVKDHIYDFYLKIKKNIKVKKRILQKNQLIFLIEKYVLFQN